MLKMLEKGEECGKAPVEQACSASGASGWICSQKNMGIISSRVYVHIEINMSMTRMALLSCIINSYLYCKCLLLVGCGHVPSWSRQNNTGKQLVSAYNKHKVGCLWAQTSGRTHSNRLLPVQKGTLTLQLTDFSDWSSWEVFLVLSTLCDWGGQGPWPVACLWWTARK